MKFKCHFFNILLTVYVQKIENSLKTCTYSKSVLKSTLCRDTCIILKSFDRDCVTDQTVTVGFYQNTESLFLVVSRWVILDDY